MDRISKFFKSKILWMVIVFPVLLFGIYQSGPFQTMMHGKPLEPAANSKLLSVAPDTLPKVQGQLSKAVAEKKAVLFSVCSGAKLCEAQAAELNKLSVEFADKVLFLQIDIEVAPQLGLKLIADPASTEMVVPKYILEGQLGREKTVGMASEDVLRKFITDGLVKVNPEIPSK